MLIPIMVWIIPEMKVVSFKYTSIIAFKPAAKDDAIKW